MFSWLLDKQNPNDKNYQQSNSQSVSIIGQNQTNANPGLKIERPTFNSVRIEGSKQNIIANSSSQKHVPQPQQTNKCSFLENQLIKHNEGDEFSIQRNNFIFSHYKTFNETNLFNLGFDITSEDPIFPNLQSIVSDIPLGDQTFYQIPQTYQNIDYKRFQNNEEIFIKNASDECLLFIFYSKPRTISQIKAGNELINRNFVYISELKQWKNPKGIVFNQNKWNFEDPEKR